MKIKDITEGAKKAPKSVPAPKERNPHAQDLAALRKSGAMGAHKDKKSQLDRKAKHKGKAFAYEEHETGPKAQAKGKGPMPKAKAGRTQHPLKGKLVGETASAGSTSSGNIATGVIVPNKKAKKRPVGQNALDSNVNIFSGKPLKR